MNAKKIFSLIICTLSVVSCGESFLDKSNPATLTYDKFYQTEADFQSALNGCYFRLKDQVVPLMIFNETTTDNTYIHSYNMTGDYFLFDICAVPTSSTYIKSFWQACYYTIMASNMVISRIKNTKMPESTQKVFVSEAKFIRAWTNFNLVRVYGGVPLYAEELSNLNEVYDVARSSVESTYEFIIQDLLDAQQIDNERSAEQKAAAEGKVNSAAVKALLGKVYLYNKEYAKAVSILSDVINNSGYRLLDNPEDIYNPDTPYNDEVILAINYERVSGQDSPLTNFTLPKFSRGILPNVTTRDNGDGVFNIEDNILRIYDKEDLRMNLIDSADIIVGSDLIRYYYTKKYLDLKTTSTFLSASDFIILRYADVLLTCADAQNQSGNTVGAYPYINAVRKRAGLADLPEGLSKEQMNDALALERQREFIGEADRWFDLSYRGISYMKSTLNTFFPTSHSPSAEIKDHMIVFPIPADQIYLKPDKLTQNNGY
jgi:hypothetical protein